MHRGEERFFQVHIVGAGEEQHGPEAVGEFVGEGGVEIFGGAEAGFRHDEFHEVADIADETLGEFGGFPRARASAAGLGGVEGADFFRAGGEFG